MSTSTSNETLSIEETARRLGLSLNHCYQLALAGKLPGAFQLGRRWRVSRAVIERLLSEGRA